MSQKSALFLVIAISVTGLSAQNKPAAEPGSRHYFNPNYNFCIDNPSNWQTWEPFDRNAIVLIPPNAQGYPRTEITVGGQVNQPSEKDETRGETLQEIWDSGVKALAENGKATNISVVEQKRTSLAGYPALTTKFEYTTKGQRWREQQIVFITRSNAVFDLALTCRPEEVERLTPVFDSVVRSFKTQCDPKLPERP